MAQLHPVEGLGDAFERIVSAVFAQPVRPELRVDVRGERFTLARGDTELWAAGTTDNPVMVVSVAGALGLKSLLQEAPWDSLSSPHLCAAEGLIVGGLLRVQLGRPYAMGWLKTVHADDRSLLQVAGRTPLSRPQWINAQKRMLMGLAQRDRLDRVADLRPRRRLAVELSQAAVRLGTDEATIDGLAPKVVDWIEARLAIP